MTISQQNTSILTNLESNNPSQQAKAIIEVIDLEVDKALPIIIKLLHSPDTMVRCNAAYALGQLDIDDIETTGYSLVQLIDDPEELVRSEVIETLGVLEYQPALKGIKNALLNDSSALVRASAAEALGYLEMTKAIETLEIVLSKENEDKSVKAYAANSLGLLVDKTIIPKLDDYLTKETSLQVKAELLGAKYYLGQKEALEPIFAILEQADLNLAIQVLNILTDLQERQEDDLISENNTYCQNILQQTEKNFPILFNQTQKLLNNSDK